jgi:hypothetical protein
MAKPRAKQRFPCGKQNNEGRKGCLILSTAFQRQPRMILFNGRPFSLCRIEELAKPPAFH